MLTKNKQELVNTGLVKIMFNHTFLYCISLQSQAVNVHLDVRIMQNIFYYDFHFQKS